MSVVAEEVCSLSSLGRISIIKECNAFVSVGCACWRGSRLERWPDTGVSTWASWCYFCCSSLRVPLSHRPPARMPLINSNQPRSPGRLHSIPYYYYSHCILIFLSMNRSTLNFHMLPLLSPSLFSFGGKKQFPISLKQTSIILKHYTLLYKPLLCSTFRESTAAWNAIEYTLPTLFNTSFPSLSRWLLRFLPLSCRICF